jgi:hypothetical protein
LLAKGRAMKDYLVRVGTVVMILLLILAIRHAVTR